MEKKKKEVLCTHLEAEMMMTLLVFGAIKLCFPFWCYVVLLLLKLFVH